MQTRKIGSLDVTVVGLGTNNFGFGMAGDAVPPVVDAAIHRGNQLLRHRRLLRCQ